jgi:peptidyl-dipeptidase Dcp
MLKKHLIVIALAALAVSCGPKAIPPTAPVPIIAPQPAEPAKAEKPAATAAENPFFTEWTAPFGVPPFDEIKPEHYMPAFEKGIAEHDAEIAAIADGADAPTFANTIEALDRSGALLAKVGPVFGNQDGALTNEEIQKIAERVMPLLAKHDDDILLNEKLFARVKALYERRDSLGLSVEQRTLLEETYKDFVRGGINLGADDKQKLRKINEELSILNVKFGDNVLKENNRFELVIDKKEDLAGLPDRVVAGAAEAAEQRGKKGAWVFTLDKPSLIPFLQYSDRRELRERMFKGYIERGDHDDELDNKANAKRIAELRIQKANLLGFKTFADFVLDRRMAKTAKAVYGLLDEVWKAALPVAKREARELQKMIRKDGQKFRLQPWDWWYYAEKERAAKYDLDENELRPYFQLENVRAAAFDLATRLYGIKFLERTDVPVYHPDVKVFEVTEENGDHLGVLFVDYFPRESKRNGAWCGGFRDQYYEGGKRVAPLMTNVGNFSKPTEGKPALLSAEEVTTLFHEFGHALNGLLSDVQYRGSGAYVKTDFVELPSQIMENWAMDPEFLKTYARHYETKAPIPDALIAKIHAARNFNEGFATVEYVAASYLDMDWHTLTAPITDDVRTFEKKALDRIGLIPEIVTRYRSTYFLHIFDNDFYAAGYYSYLWSEVLDADAFEAFKEHGLFDRKTAQSFRDNILAKGGSEDPMALYVRFRGREPSTKPMLKRKGFIK